VGDLLIRDLPERTHDELRRRAARSRMSVQAYVTRVLDQHTAVPSLGDWLARLDELPRHPELSGSEAIREGREDDLR
jgi:plasmid stability protein